MNHPSIATVLLGLSLSGSVAAAEAPAVAVKSATLANGIALTNELAPPAVTCFKLEDPQNECAIVGKPIVNYAAPSFNVVDLNGAWTGPSGELPYIYFFGDDQYATGFTIHVDMTLLNRPDAFGYMQDEKTIVVVFPDDKDYTGTLISATQIQWSNNTVWTKR